MATSRRIYRAVAKSIQREIKLRDADLVAKQAIASVARAIASDFSDDNIRFRHDKFYTACGLTEQGFPYHRFAKTLAEMQESELSY